MKEADISQTHMGRDIEHRDDILYITDQVNGTFAEGWATTGGKDGLSAFLGFCCSLQSKSPAPWISYPLFGVLVMKLQILGSVCILQWAFSWF